MNTKRNLRLSEKKDGGRPKGFSKGRIKPVLRQLRKKERQQFKRENAHAQARMD